MDDAGDFSETSGRRSGEAPGAGNQLEASRTRPHQHRLQHTNLANRPGERVDVARFGRTRAVHVAQRHEPTCGARLWLVS